MRLLRLVRHHPGVLLAVVACAFAAWVWVDVFRGPRGAEAPDGATPLPRSEMAMTRTLPSPDEDVDKPKPNPRNTAQVLPKLKPGMTRMEVEGLVGMPAAQDVLPANIEGGRVTYLASYEADLGVPPTVRPIRPMRPVEPKPSRTRVTLEFDATKPGHPLIGVHYPDPLF